MDQVISMAKYQIKKCTDYYYENYKVLATADTITEARIKAVNLLRKYRWRPDKSEMFTDLDIVDPASRFLVGTVAVTDDGKGVWFPGARTPAHMIYKNGSIGPAIKGNFYESSLFARLEKRR